MSIGLIDVDSHNYPNLALMKISAFVPEQIEGQLDLFEGGEHYDG